MTPNYAFTHQVLRNFVRGSPKDFFALMASDDLSTLLGFLWEETADVVGIARETLGTPETRVFCFRIAGHMTVLIVPPTPCAVAEAHFVAVVAVESGEVVPALSPRFIVLEAGQFEDGSPRTVLCEWREDVHVNMGDGPASNALDFIKRVELLMSDVPTGIPAHSPMNSR